MIPRVGSRGVSVVIAALLLVAITVLAAVLLYVFSIGLIGSLQSTGGQQLRQQLLLVAYDWSGATLKLTLRNLGPNDATIAQIYAAGLTVSYHFLGGCPTPPTIPVQESCRIIITDFQATIVPGVSYVVKIVTVDGAVFAYSLQAGATG